MRPVVILGAPRSGTNMLRDALCRIDGVVTWPCDELNPLWRHGNLHHPSDALPAELARPEVVDYLRRRFARLARRHDAHTVVEKTCANCLRVPFVDRVLPEARFVHIRRDPLDAIASIRARWTGRADWHYLARKARFVPPGDLPFHGLRWLRSRAHRLVSRERRVSTWGPVFDGMPEVVRNRPFVETCALQWRHCVGAAESALRDLPAERVVHVRYEALVHEPTAELARVLAGIGIDVDAAALAAAAEGIAADRVGRGASTLTPQERARIEAIVASVEYEASR